MPWVPAVGVGIGGGLDLGVGLGLGVGPSGGGQDPIGTEARECYLAGMYHILLSIVLFPFAVGASYYFGGPVIGAVWIGVVLLTCLVIYSALFSTKTERKKGYRGP